MPTEINRLVPEPAGIIADRALYITADGRVVEEDDEDVAFRLAAPGAFIEPKDVRRFGLSLKGGKVVAAKPGEEGAPEIPMGEPTEGRIDDGRPFVPVPRTGVIRTEPAPVEVPEKGTEFNPSPTLVVSNMPETDDQRAEREEMAEKAEKARKAGVEKSVAAEKASAKKSARKGK